MCEISKVQRRIFRDQDPPRIREKTKDNSRFLKNEPEFSKSTPNSPTALQQRASTTTTTTTSSLEKCLSEPEFSEKESKIEDRSRMRTKESASFSSLSLKIDVNEKRKESTSSSFVSTNVHDFVVELTAKVPSSTSSSFCDKKVRGKNLWFSYNHNINNLLIICPLRHEINTYLRRRRSDARSRDHRAWFELLTNSK